MPSLAPMDKRGGCPATDSVPSGSYRRACRWPRFEGAPRSGDVDTPPPVAHTVRMKRTNLVLPAQLLDEVVRLSGEKTYSAAVTVAMEEFVRRARARQILRLRGSGAWEGDLAVVREDKRPLRAPRKTR